MTQQHESPEQAPASELMNMLSSLGIDPNAVVSVFRQIAREEIEPVVRSELRAAKIPELIEGTIKHHLDQQAASIADNIMRQINSRTPATTNGHAQVAPITPDQSRLAEMFLTKI
ncbi:MAG: hypothetical protein L0177_19800, partial [Chloroflexi bacterium]|nr:hypothetical protein [Chloroflexota bacterium]